VLCLLVIGVLMLRVQKYLEFQTPGHSTESHSMVIDCHESLMRWEQGGRGTVTLVRRESCRNIEHDAVGMISCG
jgi:hypothetical protein